MPAVELLPVPTDGRLFRAQRAVRLGDVDPAGELRLDGIARYLQDVASDDAADAGYPGNFGWLVRRTLIRVDQPPVAGEHLSLTTFCTGWGRSWAERRTSIVGASGGSAEAVSLWVQIDISTGRPARLGDEFFGVWGDVAGDRVVSSRLSLSGMPSDGVTESPWTFRRADLDPFAHVNNAAVWSAVEELLQLAGRSRRAISGEVEYLAPASAGTPMTLTAAGGCGWLLDGDRVVVAMRISTAATDH